MGIVRKVALVETQRFINKVVLVTGGNAGIGKAAAVAFASEGAKVIITARREDVGQQVISEINASGGKSQFIRTDVTNPADVENLFKLIIDIYGRLDCVFNNAGGNSGKVQRVHRTSDNDWEFIISTNLKSIWLCMKYELEQMVRQGGGVIVNNASMLGFIGEPGSSIYVTSKHGLLGLTKSAAIEYAEKNIRINAVCPGYINTGLPNEVFSTNPKAKEVTISRIPMKRLGNPGEIAGAVLWLCSDEASFMTGQSMIIDGGQSII